MPDGGKTEAGVGGGAEEGKLATPASNEEASPEKGAALDGSGGVGGHKGAGAAPKYSEYLQASTLKPSHTGMCFRSFRPSSLSNFSRAPVPLECLRWIASAGMLTLDCFRFIAYAGLLTLDCFRWIASASSLPLLPPIRFIASA